MAVALAKAGFDVFLMDNTGYGASPHPFMDNACNATTAQQTQLLIPNPLAATCPAEYPFQLVNWLSERDEMNSVVDHILTLTGEAKVNLMGWSRGGSRVGIYAAQYPEKVERVAMIMPAMFNPTNPATRTLPQPGVPLLVSDFDALIALWHSQIQCAGEIFDPDLIEALHEQVQSTDPLASTWGTPTNELRRSPVGTYNFHWNNATAGQITVPSLVVVGEHDAQAKTSSLNVYTAVGTTEKIRLDVLCSTHYLSWELNRNSLIKGVREFLRDGTVNDVESGIVTIDREGEYL
jgi:pimeloyl-ACP methyl ester carboxylesterase